LRENSCSGGILSAGIKKIDDSSSAISDIKILGFIKRNASEGAVCGGGWCWYHESHRNQIGLIDIDLPNRTAVGRP